MHHAIMLENGGVPKQNIPSNSAMAKPRVSFEAQVPAYRMAANGNGASKRLAQRGRVSRLPAFGCSKVSRGDKGAAQ